MELHARCCCVKPPGNTGNYHTPNEYVVVYRPSLLRPINQRNTSWGVITITYISDGMDSAHTIIRWSYFNSILSSTSPHVPYVV